MSLRTRSFLWLLCGGLVAAACSRAGDDPNSDTATKSGAAAMHHPGDLPKPVDDMTEGELWDATSGLVTVPEAAAQKRDCDQGDCWGMIKAIANQKPGPGNISANGTVVAVLENLGDKQTAGGKDMGAEIVYGTVMDPKKRYLIVALPDGASWKWSVRVAVEKGTNKAPAQKSGTWSVCEETAETDSDHPKGKSAFYKCKKIKSLTGGPAVATQWVKDNPLDPGWLDCEQGCCTAGQ